FSYCSADSRHFHSFPTRRSSDLEDLRSCHTLRRGEKNAVAPAVRRLTETPAAPGAFERQDVGGVGDDFRVPDRRHDLVLADAGQDRKSTRLNSSHVAISYAVFCL